jgi:1-acyl-sn-glycerol-3-phosphate acyltransferase
MQTAVLLWLTNRLDRSIVAVALQAVSSDAARARSDEALATFQEAQRVEELRRAASEAAERRRFVADEIEVRFGAIVGDLEGGRNKGSDPYSLMPAKPGLGKIIHQSKATVFPVFLQGFPSSPKAFIRANYRKGASSAPLVHAVMGEPLDFSAERAEPASPEVYRAIGRRLMDAILAASVEEKEIRKAVSG